MEADEIKKLKEKIKKYEEEKKEFLYYKNYLIDELNMLRQEKANISKEKDKLERILEPLWGRFHDMRNKLENCYDIIINIDSLRNISKGWKVKFSYEGKKNYDIMKNEEALVVGIVGNRNRGKSFLLSKLSKDILPDGTSIKTEGISIKYHGMEDTKKADYILMDSVGFENPLLETDEFNLYLNIPEDEVQKKVKDIAIDKTLTEYFIENFIVQKSNMLIVVIGILNYPEQKLLNRIKIEHKAKDGNPPLFVIHNLQTFSLKYTASTPPEPVAAINIKYSAALECIDISFF